MDSLPTAEEKDIKDDPVLFSIIYDNSAYREDIKTDWGFSAVIRTAGRQILFDTGSDGQLLLENMRKMRIRPESIDTVFLSHHHFDHTGGLSAFLHQNSNVQIFVPESLRGIRRAKEVIHIKISRNFLTACIQRANSAILNNP
ncbi:MAG: MBL fold metallo-hydrolase [Candidatus Marinimicrobia bacterium]|nr:MBL fold metallo-hydrolase [Candidatus Neomarinimicrobiota bacterium]